jgi:chemosensory pili system protein ChpA (sensor histidine kinase/response regulator)
MNEEQVSFSENELSEEDLAVLRAFEAMDSGPTQSSYSSSTAPSKFHAQFPIQDASTDFSFEDMLLIFATEADKDINTMRRALNQLGQNVPTQLQTGHFEVFRSRGHKIRGSAGFVEFHSLVKIAQRIEEIAGQTLRGAVRPEISIRALEYAISALETTFQDAIATGEENAALLSILEEQLKSLPLDEESEESGATPDRLTQSVLEEIDSIPIPFNESLSLHPASSYMRIDAHRFADLLNHAEQLGELRTSLVSALEQVENALQELHSAQNQLAQLESKHFTLLATPEASPLKEEFPTSSLMARILNKAGQRSESFHSSYKEKSKFRAYAFKSSTSPAWDELDIEQYSEKYLSLNSLREVISEVNAASSRVQVAFAHLHLVLQEYTNQATTVHKDALVLRLVPLSNMVPYLQEVLTKSTSMQHVQFTVTGETIEIDQQILKTLSITLVQLLENCYIDTSLLEGTSILKNVSAHIWLHAQEMGNDIVIEVGFSMNISGGVVDLLRETIQQLDGTLSLQRNDAGGVSFHLRLPRSQGTIHCLLVRVSHHQVIVPFSQIQRIGDSQREEFDKLYTLHDLVGYPAKPELPERIQPVLVLLQRTSSFSVGVIVDEVLDKVELLVKPLPLYLQRPGIKSAAIDGKGRILLMPDLPELIRHYTQLQFNTHTKNPGTTQVIPNIRRTQPKILLADDSVALRNTLVQMLKHADYTVLQARDGLEALEQLIQHVPDVFLLDVEMPNLNGYDLLGIMRLYPSLATVKIIMLTSRSSEKHIQHAMDLGAHAYLTKPCSQETLVETIQKMLQT